ncbi:MAG: lytic murein transglycosylase [Vicinamibacterales bacterium]
MKHLVAVLVACAATTALAQQPSTAGISPQQPTSSATVPSSSSTTTETDSRPSFTEWLDGVRAEALSRGIRPEVTEQALADVTEPVPVVIERDRSQAEAVLSLEAYVTRQLTPERVRTGRQMVAKYKSTLDKVTTTYGVPSSIVGGIWGLESNFGRFSGVRPTIAALATLAYDGRRGRYFRSELFDALRILDRGDVPVAELKGSWAGAMGQPQFMPSSYLQFAEDFDGDGRRDIWSTPGDVFASIANYLKGHGWTPGQSWGREVSIPAEAARTIAASVQRRAGSCQATRDMTVSLPVAEWTRLGVKTLGGGRLPKSDLQTALVSGSTRHFLVSGNYDTLLQYNCAHSYALSVALLGDRIAAPVAVKAASGKKVTPTRTAATHRPSRPRD